MDDVRDPSRRGFLKTALGGAAALAVGGLARPALACGSAWGEVAPGDRFAARPEGYKVLEIMMYGGVSPWE
ncbi:twin-arginine translocation signal domain-containing protein [Myxococcota bacterium]|nr:twin-arginine translocation signal domain-containing protein [Myxococcota bacterium]